MLSSKSNLLFQSSGLFAHDFVTEFATVMSLRTILSPWKGCLNLPNVKCRACCHGMFFLGFTASAAFHLYSSIVSARQHSPCPRIELLENIQRDVCRRTGNCTGHLQPTGPTTPKSSEFWARVHCRTILTQTVFVGYPQCITGPKRPRQFSTAGLSSAVPPGMSETLAVNSPP